MRQRSAPRTTCRIGLAGIGMLKKACACYLPQNKKMRVSIRILAPAGPVGATFAICSEQEGGTPLWTEEQNIELDANGNPTVLPGSAKFAQAIIAAEITNGSFTIQTGKPNVKVSWQVTGIRQDAWAKAHRMQVEVDKAPKDQGHYIHPELFGHEGEPSLTEMHRPRPRKP